MIKLLKASIASRVFSLLLHTAPQPQLTELTATDITTVKDFRADRATVRATVFGVSPGMTMQQALQLLSAHKDDHPAIPRRGTISPDINNYR
jgi:hypothetical protein